ncbi:hypothetical protein AMC87_CH02609 [Rhizobium phaseoli]|uniref:hypothetical protein n=1 Tax=Rhizobium phaseoli TaxID=396 RepID=UPI0007EA13E7|nr:hypothetical protein [Rhizobium phaseoli]ANL47280.1 hypothetical protein AMC87_CH02609 [Rhizobium phaseoli]PDS30469.1 hypothetical protein CO650_15770 [Rhizobium phaseoli]
MRLSRLLGVLCLSTTVALSPLTIVSTDLSPAFAKGGNGGSGGNGGGGGGGGNGGGGGGHGGGGGSHDSGNSGGSHGGGNGNSGGSGKGSAHSSGKTENGRSAKSAGKAKSAKQTVSTKGSAKKTTIASAPAAKPAKKPAAELAGLNSLKRNFHALMNTADPRMAAISAFATAYAQYELANGAAPPADDLALGDAALAAALASATKTGTVNPEALSWAKDTLGVGAAVGTIDQMRETMAAPAPAAEPPPGGTETDTSDTAEGSETTDPAVTAETPEAGPGSSEEISGTTESTPAIDPTETSAPTSTETTGP